MPCAFTVVCLLCACLWCVGGLCCATSSLVIPGHLAMALLIAQCGTVGLASQSVPTVAPVVTQKSSAFETNKLVSQCSSDSASRDFLHTKSKTRNACWNFAVLVPPVVNVLHFKKFLQQ